MGGNVAYRPIAPDPVLLVPNVGSLALSGIAPSSIVGGSLVQGQVATLTGTGFGTRPDYNTGNYTYAGTRHIHFRFMTFPNAMPANGSSQATFLAALEGGFPAMNFSFNNAPSTNLLTRQLGGPSQSGAYIRQLSAGFAWASALETQTDSSAPASPNMYVCYKHSSDGDGKLFRLWFSGASPEEDWYWGGGGIYKENSSYWDALYLAAATNTIGRDLVNWRRHQIVQYGGNNTVASANASTSFYVDGTLLDYEIYTPGGSPVSPRPSGLPCMRPTQTVRNCEFNWPNSTDPGADFRYADIYQDWTMARVEITGANGKVEIQPCSAWSATAISIIFNKGEMNSGDATARIYNSANAVISTQSVTIA